MEGVEGVITTDKPEEKPQLELSTLPQESQTLAPTTKLSTKAAVKARVDQIKTWFKNRAPKAAIKLPGSIGELAHIGAVAGTVVGGIATPEVINQADIQQVLNAKQNNKISAPEATPIDSEYEAKLDSTKQSIVADRPPEQLIIGPDGKPIAKLVGSKLQATKLSPN